MNSPIPNASPQIMVAPIAMSLTDCRLVFRAGSSSLSTS